MSIVTSKEMFRKAYDGGYAIGAFNVNNMEIVQGITEAAAELRASADPAGLQGRPRLREPHLSYEARRGRCNRDRPAHLPAPRPWRQF